MSEFNKVVWTEGLFLRPQHFQQQDRHMEYLLRLGTAGLQPLRWGFSRLEVNQELLYSGKLALSACRGVMTDGTPFDLPADGPAPPPLEPGVETRDSVVYLALPLRQPGVPEIDTDGGADGAARYASSEAEVSDSADSGGAPVSIAVASPKFRLLPESAERDGFLTLPVARIAEVRADRHIILDEHYIPPVLDARVHPDIGGFLDELEGLLHQRGDRLAGRASTAGRGSAEIVDLLRLQAMNRYEPRVAHLARLRDLHPLRVYELLVEIAGELATFTDARRPPAFPAYDQDDLQATFEPVISAIRAAFSREPETAAEQIPLSAVNRFGIATAEIRNRSLLDNAMFVMAVAADMPTEKLRNHFPGQVVAGPVDRISELVNLALPGIKLRPLPAAPRQLPFHAGATYFELDRNSEVWKELKASGGLAFHIGGTYPNLSMTLWAIRQ